MKNKLFFFVAYQHLYDSDQSTGLSQFNVPSGLTDDRSVTGPDELQSEYLGQGRHLPAPSAPLPWRLLNAKLPNGQY